VQAIRFVVLIDELIDLVDGGFGMLAA